MYGDRKKTQSHTQKHRVRKGYFEQKIGLENLDLSHFNNSSLILNELCKIEHNYTRSIKFSKKNCTKLALAMLSTGMSGYRKLSTDEYSNHSGHTSHHADTGWSYKNVTKMAKTGFVGKQILCRNLIILDTG